MITTDTLKNGLTVIVETMPQVESAAYEISIPGGIILDSPSLQGSSLILAELTSRGAGDFDSRKLSEAFDAYGIRHGESADHDRFSYRGSLLADNLERALYLTSLMVLTPTLPEDEIESISSVLLQDIKAIDDNPARRVMLELHSRYFPDPYNRLSIGTMEGVSATTISHLKEKWLNQFKPKGAVISVAGNVNREEVLKFVEDKFGKWSGETISRPPFGKISPFSSHHIHFESAQLQIAIAFPSAPFEDKHYYTAKVATNILSGGMFGRLFIEVREKRGLCYSVYARHSATENYGVSTVYAGTTPERAHETLEVTLGELKRLKGSVTEEELKRAKTNMLSALVIGEESSSSRASSNAGDWIIGKRVRTMEEIKEKIRSVTAKDIDEYLDRYESQEFMLVTLGSRAIG